jgi:hypothetical protein
LNSQRAPVQLGREDRGQKTEDGGRRTEDRRQRSEDRRQRSVIGDQRSERMAKERRAEIRE